MRKSQKGVLKRTNKYNSVAPNHLTYLPIYRVWQAMNRRCSDSRCDMYYCYGGRGIRVCDRWSDPDTGFIKFYNDMGKRPIDEKGKPYQIDRIDPEGDYCPENCRWVSAKENARNTRNRHFVILNGEEIHAQQAAEIFHIKGKSLVENARRHHDGADCSNALIRILEWHGLLTKRKDIV